jgi:16S rRNA (uracil1498-N3)-methyltransferase
VTNQRYYLGADLAGAVIGSEIRLPDGIARRLTQVLRLPAGGQITVFGEGREFLGALQRQGARGWVRLTQELPAPADHAARLTLYQGMIRPSRFEWLIEKGTELGIAAFIPVITEHTNVRAEAIGPVRLERWRRIAIEATEQSLGRVPPAVGTPLPLAEAFQRAEGRLILASEGLRGQGDASELRGMRTQSGGCFALFIGPEGGFSDAEVARAQAAGARCIGLGPRVLRAETAAIVASALLLLG